MAKILIIEDNPINMELVVDLLEAAGHEAVQALEAETGLALARAEQPDLILMDIQLPGLDGLEATRRLVADEVTRAIPIVALTAHAMKGDAERCLAAGCVDYIAKPFHTQELLRKLDGYLTNRSGNPSRAKSEGKHP